MLHSGIDLHKRDLVIATVDAEGHAVRDARMSTSRSALSSYFASLPGPHRAVVESTATWYWLRDHLAAAGVDVRLGHSKYIKAISYAKVETDRVDAAVALDWIASRCCRQEPLGPVLETVSPKWCMAASEAPT